MVTKKKTGDLKTQFGARLQSLRKAAQMTQEQLADQAGVTVDTISHIERGIHGPRFDKLELIAKALDMPVAELFDFS